MLQNHTYRDGDDKDPVLLIGVDNLCLHLRLGELVRRGCLSSCFLLRLFLVHLKRVSPSTQKKTKRVNDDNFDLHHQLSRHRALHAKPSLRRVVCDFKAPNKVIKRCFFGTLRDVNSEIKVRVRLATVKPFLI